MTRKVPKTFKKYGTTYHLLKDGGWKVLYFRRGIKARYWEPMILVETGEFRGTEKHLGLPGTTTWGAKGWTFLSLREALEKFNSLEKPKQGPRPPDGDAGSGPGEQAGGL